MKKKSIKRIAYLGLLSLTCAQANASDANISVNPGDTQQTIEGIGGGIVYYQNWYTAHKNKAALYDTLFNGLGISGLRLGNWSQDMNKDLSDDAEIVNEAKKRLGKNFFIEMSSWSAPASMKANNSINGSNGGVKASLAKENGQFVYDKFGQWWRQSLERYHAVGIYPDYISIQNEPDMDAQYEATLFDEKESNEIASYGKALKAVYNAMEGMENRPKFMGPEPLGIGWNNTQKYLNELDLNLLDGICFHYYHSGDQSHDNDKYSYPDDYINAMKGLAVYESQKPLFMTENCSMRDQRKQDALHTAWFIANAINYNKVVSYLHWNLLWGESGGCITVDNPWDESQWKSDKGFTVQSEYHGLRHFSKFVQRGWQVVSSSSTDQDVISTAFKSPNGEEFTIVLINKGYGDKSASIAIGGDSPEEGQIIQTVPDKEIWSKVIGNYTKGAEVSLPSNSITTITMKAGRTIEWNIEPQSDPCESAHQVSLVISKDLDSEATIYLNSIAKVKDIKASSIWMNEEGTFGWEAENALVVGDEGRWGAAGTTDEWLEIDLEEPTIITSSIIDETSGIGCNIRSYELQYEKEGEWITIESGASIGSNYTTQFDPVKSDKFRLFIVSSDCINVNYFGLLGKEAKLTTNKSTQFTIEPLSIETYLTLEKDGIILSKSENIPSCTLTQTEEAIAANDLLSYQEGTLLLHAEKAGQVKIFNAQGSLLYEGNVEQGDNSIFLGKQNLLIVLIGDKAYKVLAN
ncbi:MAG: discoidin domain-containing protein [Paludibacteraceae bacterium]|nr:discoidin domain-containing protein [Paludibacteraceae bacterium]